MMLLLIKFLIYTIVSFVVMRVFLNKTIKMDKMIQLSLVISSGLFIVDYFMKNRINGKKRVEKTKEEDE